jgi:tetratricopeptide (TPR) repeat protein
MLDALLRKGVVHLLAISVLGLIAYSNTFNSPFHFDDIGSIVNNPIVKDLGYFSEPEMAKGLEFHKSLKKRYVGYLTFALNYGVHGLNVTGYHVVNLLIHIANAFLVYFLILLMFKTPFLEISQLRIYSRHIAVITALLFVSHPVQTQAVTYIVQRLTSLATMFYMASLLAYVKSRLAVQGPRRYVLYPASLIFAALAMKTKEIAFTLPLIITLFEFSFLPPTLPRAAGGTKVIRRAFFLIPLFVIMLAMLSTVIEPGRPLSETFGDIVEVKVVEEISRHDYMLTESRVLVTYLRLLAFPVRQNLDYDYPVFNSFFDLQVLLSFLFLSGIFCLAVFLYCRSRITDYHSESDVQKPEIHSSRLIAFGIFWFFLALSVESSIVPLHPIYEHRVYLPSVGVFIAIATLAFLAVDKFRQSRLPLLTALTALIVVFSATTYARNSVWQSEISLWEDTAGKSPHRARVQNNLGSAYISAGMFDKAEKRLNIALALKPDYAMVHNNLGLLYSATGQNEKALKHQLTAIGLDPEFPGAYYDLGSVYMVMGMPEKAVDHYSAALRLNPGYAEAHYEMGTIYCKKGESDNAAGYYMTAIKLNPGYAEAYNGLGNAYFKKGMMAEALKYYMTALRLRNDYAEAHFNTGVIYLIQGSTELAEEHFYQALQPRDYIS